jgi:diadenylate cyclase
MARDVRSGVQATGGGADGARAPGPAKYDAGVLSRPSATLIESLAAVAPGRPLREGLDRILQANMGALIVVGDGPEVLNICSGGFLLDAEFSPQRLSELAKMDGAIILAPDSSRIARANVHLVPNPNVPTSETGTRHRTAERVARSIDVPVISVSEDMSVIAVYRNDQKHPLDPIPRLVARANQALQTLERYKNRLDAVSGALSALEVEDLVTVRDVVTVLQRAEMVRRIAEEIEGYIVELGVDGRLILLQLEELMGGVEDDRRYVIRDYSRATGTARMDDAIGRLSELSTTRILDLREVARLLDLTGGEGELDAGIAPRGYRLLAKIPRLPDGIIANIIERFGTLHKILRATVGDLDEVEGVGDSRARAIKDGLSRLAETSILDRYS